MTCENGTIKWIVSEKVANKIKINVYQNQIILFTFIYMSSGFISQINMSPTNAGQSQIKLNFKFLLRITKRLTFNIFHLESNKYTFQFYMY